MASETRVDPATAQRLAPIPAITCAACRPVSVKYIARNVLVAGRSPAATSTLYSYVLTPRNVRASTVAITSHRRAAAAGERRARQTAAVTDSTTTVLMPPIARLSTARPDGQSTAETRNRA